MTATVAGLELPAPNLSPAELELWARSFLAGWEHGLREGYERHDLTVGVDTLIRVLGGPEAVDCRDAVRRHERLVDQRTARNAADQPGPRDGDFAGRPQE